MKRILQVSLTLTLSSMILNACTLQAEINATDNSRSTSTDSSSSTSTDSSSSTSTDSSSSTSTDSSSSTSTDSSTSTSTDSSTSTSTDSSTSTSTDSSTSTADLSAFENGIPHPDKVKNYTTADIAKAKEMFETRYKKIASSAGLVLEMYIEAYMLVYRNEELGKALLSVVEKGGELDSTGIAQAKKDPEGGRIFRSYWMGTTPEKDYMEILEPSNWTNRALDYRENAEGFPRLDPKTLDPVNPKPLDTFQFYIKSTGVETPRKVNLIMNGSNQWKMETSINSSIYVQVLAPPATDF